EPGLVIGRRMRRRQAAVPLTGVAAGRPRNQRVTTALRGQRDGQVWAPAGERRVPPAVGVAGVMGVPGLMSAEEVAEPEVHQSYRCTAANHVPMVPDAVTERSQE